MEEEEVAPVEGASPSKHSPSTGTADGAVKRGTNRRSVGRNSLERLKLCGLGTRVRREPAKAIRAPARARKEIKEREVSLEEAKEAVRRSEEMRGRAPRAKVEDIRRPCAQTSRLRKWVGRRQTLRHSAKAVRGMDTMQGITHRVAGRTRSWK